MAEARARADCARLRRELQASLDSSANAMMQTAMAASTQALSDEAATQRRARMERRVLIDELQLVEGAWAASAGLNPQKAPASDSRLFEGARW